MLPVNEVVKNFIKPFAEKRIAVAVSGGSDSLALLYALYEELGTTNLVVFHFDHGLRVESKNEAQWVSELCAGLGLPCAIRTWSAEGRSRLDAQNMLQKARQARYAAFRELCKEYQVEAVCLGHTADDVSESFVMRLGRGSGLAGLSAMQSVGEVLGVKVLRPVLDCSRQSLKDYLTNRDQTWVSDPSNEKETYLRVRVRHAKDVFEKMGLAFESIYASAQSLRRAENALNTWCQQLWDEIIHTNGNGSLTFNELFWHQVEEMQLRLLSKAMVEMTGDPLSPRTSKRISLLENMREVENGKWTLGGVIFEKKKGHLKCAPEAHPELLRVEKLLKRS